MKRILITNRRYGSTLVHKYIERANRPALLIDDPSEFFNPKQSSFSIGDNFSSTELKIKFLEEQRKKEIEYSHKTIAYDINYLNIKDWFDEFYKDWEKVILHRKNKWNPFLSYVVQNHLGIQNERQFRRYDEHQYWPDESTHSYRNDPVEEKIISELKPFYITYEDIEFFWYNEDLLNTWDGTKIYLEDHMPDAHNSLCSYFNVSIRQEIFKIKLDYEKYVLNLAEAKDWFYRYGV